MTDVVYVLWHVRGDEEDAKLIGVYRSQADIEAAIGRLKCLPGFRDHQDSFQTDAYALNQDHWSEGFGE
jgi:hypothetical protein